MKSEELESCLKEYTKLEELCRVTAKRYLDLSHSGKYYGHVNTISINVPSKNFHFTYYPSTSGIGGNGTLSFSFLGASESVIKEKINSDHEARTKEEKDSKCKECGAYKNNFVLSTHGGMGFSITR